MKKRYVLIGTVLVILVTMAASKPILRWMYPLYHYRIIEQSASSFNVDPMLVAAIIRVESKFKEDDVSRAGAIGLMQLMPQTAEWIAEQSGLAYDNPDDLAQPQINIRLGSWYIAYLEQRFNGNRIAAIAAYNSGPSRVDKWLKNGTWDGTLEHLDQVPVGETRHYVQRVLYNFQRYKEIYS
ncbi:lytic transglycosylase domain-containing protein [Effusibacillus lacus]|uniref:Lytic transglycosylase n=1 Tax=Effusibacillus lacus TaxID=1348429 RepID=A0A292YKR4_9BACL|nr:lytic transglycosylase domain-containing protein [Effusibacillus lacus]TCS73609.1 soluble lytic murein transglycosylase [Effusibacillus lacus]GAX89499.1 lytic transglycosylase [Effusibacillus lacus]